MSDSCPLGTPRGGSRPTSIVTYLLVAGLVIGPSAIHMLSLGEVSIPAGWTSTAVRTASPRMDSPDSFATSAQQSIASREYEASRNDRGLQAPNRAHNLRTYFEPWGVRVEDRTAEGSPELFRMKTVALGRDGRAEALIGGEIRTEGARVENRRGDGIVEWYVNGEDGLEHGYVLDQRLEGEGDLQIEVTFDGTTVSVSSKSALIKSVSGQKFEYSKLVVVDAVGRHVAARMESADAQTVRMIINDESASYPIVVDPLLTSTPDALLESNQMAAGFGYVAGAGDVNGDGFADVIIGANGYDAGQENEGAVFVFHGSPAGIPSGGVSTAATLIESDEADANLGLVASAGDVNGDGYTDVILNAGGYDVPPFGEGAVFVFHGGPSGIPSGSVDDADSMITSNQAGGRLDQVASAGDVNGDGYGDVLVGSTQYDTTVFDAGAVFILHGGPAGIASGTTSLANTSLVSFHAGSFFGGGIAGADVNSDGYSDVVVGASSYNSAHGAAFVFQGGPSGIPNGNPGTASTTLAGQANSQFGISVANAGDVNGDGYGDVIIGSALYSNGQSFEGGAFLYHGGAAGIPNGSIGTANAAFESNQAIAGFGCAVAGAGDVNGDGYSDVLVGARDYDVASTAGAAFLFVGSPSGTGNGTPATAFAVLTPNQTSLFGASLGAAGDIDGDGFADLVVGASNYSNGESGEGAAYLYLGGAEGVRSGNPATANGSIQSNQVGARIGWSVAGAGDVNGDSYADVIVGAPSYDAGQINEGAAFVFHGGPAGIQSGNPAMANTTLQSDQSGSEFGAAVSGAGDVNSDGYADVIVGADSYDYAFEQEGAAFVFHGGPSGVLSGNPTTANAILQSGQGSSFLGADVAGAGDVNGDGFADVIVGAREYEAGQMNEGAVFVFHGGPSGIASGNVSTANSTIESDQATAEMYNVAGAGDVNGDGYADVIIGARRYDDGPDYAGAAFIFHGGPSGIVSGNPAMADTTLQSDQEAGNFGRSVASAGDVNGDGFADVIVGTWQYDAPLNNEGAAFVFHGSPMGIATGGPATANTILQSNVAEASMGFSAEGAGDVNGDGFADVVVGARGFDDDFEQEGAAFVFNGGPSGIPSGDPTTASSVITADQGGTQFGVGVAGAGDVNGDGYADVVIGADIYDSGQIDEGAAFVFHGNGDGLGRSVRARQLRGNGDATNVEPWGSSIDSDDFQVRMSATHPLGRGKVKLQIQATPDGENWGGPNNVTVASASWTDVTATAAGVTLTESVAGLAPSTLYRWRARVLYAPFSFVTPPTAPGHGPWRRLGGQALEADIRTDGCPLTCPANAVAPNDAGMCGASVNYQTPSTTGSCGTVACVPASGSFFPIGTTTVNCSSASGPSCSFTVTVNDTQAPTVSCPAPVTVGTDSGQCSAVVSFATPAATDNCPGTTVSCVPASGSTFPVGTTMVTCTATDASANTASCSFSVTVIDTEAPTVACPSPISVPNAPGQCSAVVNFATPSASDNCAGATVACVPASGATFPIGVTTVTCTATDAASNTGSCSFSVTVNDTEAPAVTCPAPISVGNTPGQCSAVVTYSASASDNCPGFSLSCVPASGSTFPVGVATVTCTATDAELNTGVCSFNVTVIDNEVMAITCPANIQTVASTPAGRIVNYSIPVATDNCGATVACLPASGSTFAIGTTTVTCTATDAANNATNCQFTVEVASLGTDTAGIYVPTTGSWFLRNANSPGAADLVFGYGPAGLGWIALRGDWDGNGSDTAGLYDPANGNFFLKNTNAAGGADLVYGFGPAGFGWQPLVGDWDGDGVDTIGLYDPSSGFFFLRNTHAPGAADLVYGFGPAGTGWTPMLGDWDGNGTDTVGLYDPATGNFFLRNAHAAGGADLVYGFGPAGIGWKPVAGDWNGDGADTIGLYSPANGFFFLRNFHAPGAADVVFGYGPANTTPILGDWNGL